MQIDIDRNDPLATAAAALSAARKAAALLRGDLPRILGERSPTISEHIAHRLERGGIPDTFARHALETLIIQCQQVIARGTTEEMRLLETGWGGNGPIWRPEPVTIRTPEAEEAVRALEILEHALDLAERTHDLIAAEEALMKIRG